MHGNPSFLVISRKEEKMNNIRLAEETMGQRIKAHKKMYEFLDRETEV